jgi:hypothetical protein
MEKSREEMDFDKLLGYTKKLQSRYLNTLAALMIFDRLDEAIVAKKVGKKKAKQNVKIINYHLYFFQTTKEAIRCHFLIELAKFFDIDKRMQSLTIKSVIQFSENNLSSFSTENFLKYHKNRHIFPELFKEYKPLNKNNLSSFTKRLRHNKDRIERLKTYRDKWLAHDDLEKIKIDITKKDVATLMKIIKDLVDLLHLKLEFSSTIYQNYEENPKNEVDTLFAKLVEHEKQRIEAIEREYCLKIKDKF